MSAFSVLPAMASYHTDTTPEAAPSQGAGMGMTGATADANIVELAAGNESFNTLVQAVEASGLTNTLAQEGPYTVFAPTDEAFAELPDGALEFLLRPENQGLLQQVLTYHVVPGEVTSNQLSTGSVDTLGGGVSILLDDGRVIVNDGSVIQADLQASNGVVHAVNRVLLPTELRQALVSELNNAQ